MNLVRKYWFLLAIVAAFSVVVLDPTGTTAGAGMFLKRHHGPAILVFCVFILTGLLLDMNEIFRGMKDIPATVAALSLVFMAAPAIAFFMGHLPMSDGMRIGLYLTAVMPTTFSSGIVMTATAGGRMAHALFITVTANILCIVTIPFTLGGLLSSMGMTADIQLDRTAIMIHLCLLLLLPLVLGLFLRRIFSRFCRRRYLVFQRLNQWMIVCVVFIAAAGAREVFWNDLMDTLMTLPLAALFHGLLLAAAMGVCRLLGFGKGRRESVLFMGGQKTLALSVILQLSLFPEYGAALLLCVMHHLIHLVMDGFLSQQMASSR